MPTEIMQNPHLEGAPFVWLSGPVGVLLVHGLTATSAEVRPLAQALLKAGYSVAGPLLPGHGETPEEVNRYRWQDWADTIEEAYRALRAHCQCVFAGGESTGAILALELAARHPEIAGILLFAPALRLNRSRLDLLLLRLAVPFIPTLPKPTRSADPPAEADRLWQGYYVNPLRGTVELLRLQSHVRARLPLITQAIFIAQGSLDQTVHPSAPGTIYSRVRSALKELHWFANSHHCLILDVERQQVAALTLAFISRAMGERGSEQLIEARLVGRVPPVSVSQ